jgi:formylglycine-generating enzyme required for sulfatase activity
MDQTNTRAHWLTIAFGLLLASCTEASDRSEGENASARASTSAAAQVISARPSASAAVGDAGADAGADAVSATVKADPPAPLPDEGLYPATLDEQREALFRRMIAALHLTSEQMAEVRAIFEKSPVLGQGNPKVTVYPMTRRECREAREAAGVVDDQKAVCGATNMAPIFDAAGGESEKDAKACVDRYEFPSVPCEHPVVFATAREAALLCKAVGKRLCDAHEWEGACAGSVKSPEAEYAFGKGRREMKEIHNKGREIVWSYGPEKDHARCATKSRKSKKCSAGGWKSCGSNTYPAGAFPACVSPFGVYDLHGNAAEHMNLPMTAEELSSRGGMGVTEMKGSWFTFSSFEAHIDDCRWRAPDWHATKVMDVNSHGNYHLGFRCCKTIEPGKGGEP